MDWYGVCHAHGMADPMPLELMFVDDEPQVLEGLHRALRPQRGLWSMRFCLSGEIALRELAYHRADVVVSDMCMPGMSGAEFLGTVLSLWPGTVRLVLSGHAEAEQVQRVVGPTHQFLLKPCPTTLLFDTVRRATRLRHLLNDRRIGDLLGGLTALPDPPGLYYRLAGLNGSSRAGPFAGDPVLSATMLRLVDMAEYGFGRRVSGIQEAVAQLGLDSLRALALASHIFAFYGRSGSVPEAMPLWRHSLAVACLARRIAQAECLSPIQVEEAFLAALVHDVGKLVLGANLPEESAEAQRLVVGHGMSGPEAERVVFGASHAEVGACLLGQWGISDTVVEAVAWHHQPVTAGRCEFTALSAVHVADAFDRTHSDAPKLCVEYLRNLGRVSRLPAWVALARAA
jgi:putative nucleotidyltransferase with HDIG domain